MNDLFINYMDSSPRLINRMSSATHDVLVEHLRAKSPEWKGFWQKYEGFSLIFTIATENGAKEVNVRGPGIYRKAKDLVFAVILPEGVGKLRSNNEIDSNKYLGWVFEGIHIALEKYGVKETELSEVLASCKAQLNEKRT